MSEATSRRQFLRRSANLLGALALTGVTTQLLGCTTQPAPAAAPGADTPAARPKELKIPRIALTAPTQPGYVYTVVAPLEYGSRFGLNFKDVDLVTFQSHSTATQTVLSGRADLIGGSTMSHLALIDQGQPFKLFAPFSNFDAVVLAGRNHVQTVEDIIKPETRIAVDSPGGLANTILNAILKAKGVDFRLKDLKNVVVLESSGLRLGAWTGDKVDVAVIHKPHFDQGKQQIGASARNLGTLYESVPIYMGQAFAAPAKWLDENLDSAVAFTAALLTANRELTSTYELYLKMVRKHIAGGGPEEPLIQDLFGLIRNYDFWPVNGGLSNDHVKFMIDLALEEGIIKKQLTVDQVVDRRALDAALKLVGTVNKADLLK